MAQHRLVLVLVLQVALQVALDHAVLLAYRPGAQAILAHLGARVARAQIGLEEGAIVARTKRVTARALDIVQTFTALHAHGVGWRVLTRVGHAARTLTGRTFGMWFQLALPGRILAGIVAAGLFAVLSVAAVALLARLNDAVAAQRSVVLFEAELGRILHERMHHWAHLVLAALGEVAIVALGAGRGAPVHDEVAAFGGARRTVAVVGIVLGAEVVADFVRERDLRDGFGHASLIVDDGDDAAVQALGDALQRLTPLAYAANAAGELGNPGETERAVGKVTSGKRVGQAVVGEVVKRHVVEESRHVQIGFAQFELFGSQRGRRRATLIVSDDLEREQKVSISVSNNL